MADRKDGGTSTQIDRGLIDRVSGAFGSAMAAFRSSFFGPGEPPAQIAPDDVRARILDYRFNTNYNWTPRVEDGTGITFEMLRNLADYDLVRIAIETRKDQLEAIPWQIRAKAKEGELPQQTKKRSGDTANVKALSQFFKSPDGMNTWNTWLRLIMEDLLVIDAPAILPRHNFGGELVALDVIDGATIKRFIDKDGRTPQAPAPAYVQVLKGMPAVELSSEELIYRPRNMRPHKLYGMSPVEQIWMYINLAIRRSLFQLYSYTEGNIPEAIAQVPADWSADDVKRFQEWFDSVMAGNLKNKRKMIFIPGAGKSSQATSVTFTKEGQLKDEMDEWLARVICYCFSLPPTAFVKQMNRAVAQQVQETAESEGLIPMMQWVANVINYIIEHYLKIDDAEFAWLDDKVSDPLAAAQIHTLYLEAQVLSIEEVREDLGRPPLDDSHTLMINGALVTVAQAKQIAAAKTEQAVNPPPPPVIPGQPGQPGQNPNQAGATNGKDDKGDGGKPNKTVGNRRRSRSRNY